MSCTEVERCMAALFTQAEVRRTFLRDPQAVLQAFDLDENEREGLTHMDMTGLVLAGNSFSAKRAKHKRWMHTLVKAVPEYDGIVEPAALASARSVVAYRAACQASSGQAGLDLRRLDFIAWDSDSHHNREHMLQEGKGLGPMLALWNSLKSAVLLNHHLLRCYAVSSSSPVKQSLHREHPRAGCSLTYLTLDADADLATLDELVLADERQNDMLRVRVRSGGCVVVPADLLHRFEHTSGPPGPGRLLLVFKSLSAIQ